jgi:predicted RND superfamily exporter protein
MIWQVFGTFIIRHRTWLLIAVGILTLFAGWHASKVQLTYDFAKVIPKDDPDLILYNQFKQQFGEDGSVLVVGVQSDKLFTDHFFNGWARLTNEIGELDGIEKVVSLANIYRLTKNEDTHRFDSVRVLNHVLRGQADVDSFRQAISELPFYKGILYNPESGVTLLLITMRKDKLDSRDRIPLVQHIEEAANRFGASEGVELYYSGLPYVRTVYSSKVADEVKIFTYLSIFVTALFIFIFFRFFSAVFFSLIVVAISVICTLGSIHLFGYKITLLTGILPPLMVIIGVQNCIYLLNVYHQEFRSHGNKMLAIIRLVTKNGLPLFLTNVTTAVGFCAFSFSGSDILDQFSVISGINIMLVYVVSLVFIPIVYSYLPPPKPSHTKHLDSPRLNRVMDWCYKIVHEHRRAVYITTILLCIISLLAALRVHTLGYVVDDLPANHKVYTDLKFFEKHFKGVLPYEIEIDTKKPGGVKDLVTLHKMSRLERELSALPELSRPVSVTDIIKFANQGYNGGNPKYFVIPGALDIPDIMSYMPARKPGQKNLLKSMVDSTYRLARISFQMADIGSVAMKDLNARVRQITDSIFDPAKYTVKLTGTSLIFLKGNDYLVENLLQSMVVALIIISLMMAFLFSSWKMVLISLVPNIVPLLMTVGIMGFFDIRLKPSTIIIFSIAYGIVVDFTIHYLAKYRHALVISEGNMARAIPKSLMEAGPSIIYTAVALFFGFIIFAASDFGGTVALGVLTSLSLVFGMLMNLILLPALLLSLEKSINSSRMLKSHVPADDYETEQ